MITFLSQPETIQPVYSNLVYQFISTAATDPSLYRYRYVVNVFTQDGLIAELKITPSSQGWGQIDLSPILLNYTSSKPVNLGCSGDTIIQGAAWGYLRNNMIIYDIMVGEEYATSSTGVVIGYDGNGNPGVPNVKSDVCYATNGVKEWFNGKSYDFDPFYLTGQTGTFPQYTSRFLTNSPRTRYIRQGDYALLAALNWYDTTTDLPAREIYSALFTFYNENDVVVSTGRTYNTESICGTRPNCSYYDGWWDTPTNWTEQQVVYLGVGSPNLEEHGINIPATTKYYKVELESTLNTPPPPTPEIDVFDGCSCGEYQYTNPALSPFTASIEYLDCNGDLQTININPGDTGRWCCCQNTNIILDGDNTLLIYIGACNNCVCNTYDLSNTSPFLPAGYSFRNCSGDTITGELAPLGNIQVCACEGSVSSGITTSLVGTCPLPFVQNCHEYQVSTNVGYNLDITYTGCCGTLLTITIPPSTNVNVEANSPFPTDALWNATDLGGISIPPCPTPTPSPTPLPVASGQPIVAVNVCDGGVMYFRYSGSSIGVGQFVNYENTIYEITEIGGGGFIQLTDPYVFDDLASATSAFPCPTTTTGSCLTTLVISEPFYFYYDDNCSPGNRVVFFLNKLGAWDNYNFRAREDVGYSVEKQVVQKNPELYSAGWDTPSYNGWNSQRSVWSELVGSSGVLYTDLLPQAESLWLSEELTQSPSVYLVGDNGVLEPVVITNTEVVKPNYQINSSKYQIQIEYKSSYNTIRQNHE
jgi:hypothetical protein